MNDIGSLTDVPVSEWRCVCLCLLGGSQVRKQYSVALGVCGISLTKCVPAVLSVLQGYKLLNIIQWRSQGRQVTLP